MASNPPGGTIVSATQPEPSPPLSHAATYAQRLAQVEADADDYFSEGLALLTDDSETRAPAQPHTPDTAPTTGAATPAAQGPENADAAILPAAATTPATDSAGTPATPDQPPDPIQLNNRRRAESQQAILQRELEETRRREAALAEANAKLLSDNRILFNQHDAVRNQARARGAVRYEEVDQALTDASVAEQQLREQERLAVLQQQQVVAQQQAGWRQAVDARVQFGTTARERAISQILVAAIETQQPLTYEQAEGLIKEGYQDPNVRADIDLWRRDDVTNDLANQRLGVAYDNIVRATKTKLTQQAMQALAGENQELPVYNRTMAYGNGEQQLPANNPARAMTYQQRLQADISAANDAFDRDLARLNNTG